MPWVRSVLNTTAYKLDFTGLGFTSLSGYSAGVSFLGVNADTVSVNSDTSVSAIFANGIPIGKEVIPQLFFTDPT